jgi:hypothetical protein
MKAMYQNFLKGLLVGMGYAVALSVGGVIVSVLGLSLPPVKDVMTKITWSLAGGVIAGLCLGRIAASIPTAQTRHIIIWGSVIFLNLASVAIEGFFFVPEVVGNILPALLIQQCLASLATACMITLLFAPTESAMRGSAAYRPFFSWIWRFPASALTYVFFYFVFGAFNLFSQ